MKMHYCSIRKETTFFDEVHETEEGIYYLCSFCGEDAEETPIGEKNGIPISPKSY